MTELKMTYLCTVDGDPWAVFTPGHCPDLVTREAIAAAMNEQGGGGEGDSWLANEPEPFKAETFYVTHMNPKGEDLDCDADAFFCKANAPGAYVVTGVKF